MKIHGFQHPDAIWTWKIQGTGKVSHPPSREDFIIGSDNLNTLSAQILSRSNQIKSCYLAKAIHARLKSLEYMIAIPSHTYSALRQYRTIETMRNIEAIRTTHCRRKYCKRLNPHGEMIHKDKGHQRRGLES